MVGVKIYVNKATIVAADTGISQRKAVRKAISAKLRCSDKAFWKMVIDNATLKGIKQSQSVADASMGGTGQCLPPYIIGGMPGECEECEEGRPKNLMAQHLVERHDYKLRPDAQSSPEVRQNATERYDGFR